MVAAVAVGSAGLLGAAVATTTQSVTEDTTKQTFLIYLLLLDVCWRCCVLEQFFCFYDEKTRTKDDSSFGGCGGDKEYTIHTNEQMQNSFPTAVGDRFKNNAGVCFR